MTLARVCEDNLLGLKSSASVLFHEVLIGKLKYHATFKVCAENTDCICLRCFKGVGYLLSTPNSKFPQSSPFIKCEVSLVARSNQSE